MCGFLTGAALAAGFAARARFDDDRQRCGAALYAATQLANVHSNPARSVDCVDITDTSLTRLSGRLRYFRQGKGRMCGRLHLKWAPQAHRLIDNALKDFAKRGPAGSCVNCAVQTLCRLDSSVGLKVGDSVLVAGFAGGIGLVGNVCGALAAGVFAMAVGHQLARERDKRDSRLRGTLEELIGANYRGPLTRLRLEFLKQFGSELCVDIVGRRFQDAADHSGFVERGGCENVMMFVAGWTTRAFGTKTD
jgi:hypothetical protein